jgi:hypothetical protein
MTTKYLMTMSAVGSEEQQWIQLRQTDDESSLLDEYEWGDVEVESRRESGDEPALSCPRDMQSRVR